MKTIKYHFLSCEIHHGTEVEQVLLEKTMFCKNQREFDECYPTAKLEAVDEIIVEGEFEPEVPTDKDRIAQLEEALELLLSGVTE